MPRPVRPLRRRASILVPACAALATACDARHDAPAPPTRAAAVAPARMADTLAASYARALADVQRNAFLNRARADALAALAASQSGPDAMQARYQLAQERLLAGQTREAIDGLETLRRAASITLDPRNRAFYDLLAVAYFRLGEQENCFGDMAANMCILPLAGRARHTRQEGARQAIALYDAMLRAEPADLGSRWLLNLAHLAVGEYPGGVPASWRIPALDRRRDRAFPTFRNVAHAVGVDVTGLSAA